MTKEQNFKPVEVKVWGDFACFTRPEMKVERVSYEAPTPSAARNVLQAIFWKPQFDWEVQEIVLLKPIQRMSILRNEVTKQASSRGDGRIIVEDDRTQRHSLILRDVAYIIRAEPIPKNGKGSDRAKYRDQFRRRVKKGQCLWRPYLGCREFSAYFDVPTGEEIPIPLTMGLGRMLFDLQYKKQGKATPYFFQAEIQEGILRVPQHLYTKRKS